MRTEDEKVVKDLVAVAVEEKETRDIVVKIVSETHYSGMDGLNKNILVANCIGQVKGDGSNRGEVATDPTLSDRKKKTKMMNSTGEDSSSRNGASAGELGELISLLARVVDDARISRIQQLELAEKQRITEMKLFFLTQIADTERAMDIAEEKYHTTNDDFYKSIASRKRRKLEDLQQSLHTCLAHAWVSVTAWSKQKFPSGAQVCVSKSNLAGCGVSAQLKGCLYQPTMRHHLYSI